MSVSKALRAILAATLPVALLAALGLAAPPAAAQGTPVVVIHLNLDNWNQGFPNSGLARLWNDPAVQQWRSTTLQQLLGQMRGQSGVELSAFTQHLTGEAFFVVVAPAPGGPGALSRPNVALGVRQPGQIDALMNTINGNLNPQQQQVVQATTLRQGSDIAVFGTDPALNQTLLNQIPQGAAGLGLPANEAAFFNARINLGYIIQQLEQSLNTMGTQGPPLAALGIRNLHALGFAAAFQGSGMVVDGEISTSGPRTGLMNLLGENGEFGLMSFVPSNATGVSAVRLAPPTQIYDWVQQVATSMGSPQVTQMMTMQVQAMTGMDLRQQILPALGQEFAFVSAPSAGPSQMGMMGGPSALIIEVKDQQVIDQVITAAITMWQQQMAAMGAQPGQPPPPPPQPTLVTQGDVTYKTISAGPMVQICYGFVGNYLVASLSQEAMNAVIAARGGPGIAQSPGYQAVSQGINPQSVVVNYSDTRAEFGAAAQMLPMMMMGMGGQMPPEVQQTMALLPNLTQYLGQMGSSVTAEPERLAYHGYSTTGIEPLLIAGAGLAVPAAIAVPNFMEAQTRAKVARVRSDMRSMATALEAFFIDNNKYPIWVVGSDPSSVAAGDPLMANMPTLSTQMSLTTPIAYITSYFRDPFGPNGSTFSYYSDNAGWILLSPGPDGVFDIDPRQLYSSSVPQPSPQLLQYAFDPTNGTVSAGDIFRVRQ